jgi:hypothetical protein
MISVDSISRFVFVMKDFFVGFVYVDFVSNSASRHEELGRRSKAPRIPNLGGTFS